MKRKLPCRKARRRVRSAVVWAYRNKRTIRWRKEYGGLKVDQAKRVKELEKENSRLRRAVSDLTLYKQILTKKLSGNY